MELLYLFYIFCGLFLLAGAIIWGITLGINRACKNEEKAIEKYLNEEGKQDIPTMETYLKDHQIAMPRTLPNDTKTAYMERLLEKCNRHYKAIYQKTLEDAGYTKSVRIRNFATIYYNSESAIIMTCVLSFPHDHLRKKSDKIGYGYEDEQGNEAFFSLKELIEVYESFGKPDAPEKHGLKMPVDDICWYVVRPASSGYKLADKAAGAVVGGLLLGPVGALAGGMSASKSQKKDEKNEIEVIFGGESIGHWSVAKGDYRVQDPIEQLTEHFPKKRLPDRYQKTV